MGENKSRWTVPKRPPSHKAVRNRLRSHSASFRMGIPICLHDSLRWLTHLKVLLTCKVRSYDHLPSYHIFSKGLVVRRPFYSMAHLKSSSIATRLYVNKTGIIQCPHCQCSLCLPLKISFQSGVSMFDNISHMMISFSSPALQHFMGTYLIIGSGRRVTTQLDTCQPMRTKKSKSQEIKRDGLRVRTCCHIFLPKTIFLLGLFGDSSVLRDEFGVTQ